jgi:uncharacterized protein (TIGR02118 family)
MYKVMIIVPPDVITHDFDAGWPEFLHQAESMPGLLREASIRVAGSLYGGHEIDMIHELYFETLENLQEAMSSPEGLAAGQIIQQLTQGQMTLLIAEHREDNVENLRRYREDD